MVSAHNNSWYLIIGFCISHSNSDIEKLCCVPNIFIFYWKVNVSNYSGYLEINNSVLNNSGYLWMVCVPNNAREEPPTILPHHNQRTTAVTLKYIYQRTILKEFLNLPESFRCRSLFREEENRKVSQINKFVNSGSLRRFPSSVYIL